MSVSFISSLNDLSEDVAPPGQGAVVDKVGRAGDEWSVMSVELARLVRKTVVVRVTDRSFVGDDKKKRKEQKSKGTKNHNLVIFT